MRFWGAQSNGFDGATLDDYLAPPITRRSTGGGSDVSLGGFLRVCEEVGCDPWLIISVSFSEEEWQGLIEYLAGPADSPYGRLRLRDRGGDPTPWIDTFPRWYLESDNETWNFSFKWGFKGDPESERKNDRAYEYGQFAELMFRAAQASPHWQTAGLDGKVEFIVNGWNVQQDADGYGAVAAKAAPSASYADVAPYFGGWEQGNAVGGDGFNDEGVRQWLAYLPWKHQGQVDSHVATARQLGEAGEADYRLAVYEGGPGYDLPGPNNPSGDVPESYGKSLAAGLATLDCYLYEQFSGYGPQGYFGFREGTRWSSHAAEVTDRGLEIFRHTTFLALGLRNRHARGLPVQVTTERVPTADFPERGRKLKAREGGALVGCYPFLEGKRLCVLLLNRQLDVEQAVTLQLPFAAADSIELHKLEDDPRRSNSPRLPTWTGESITIQHETIAPTQVQSGSISCTLPPGAIRCYVIEGR